MPLQRKNRQGQLTWYGRVKVPGRSTPIEKRCATQRDAIAWEVSQQRLIEHLPKNPQVVCGDWAEAYIKHVKARGEVDVQQKILTFKRFFNVISPLNDITKLTPQHFLAFIDQIATKISGARANKTAGYLRHAYGWGQKFMGLPHPNPLDLIPKYKTVKNDLVVPSEEDFWKVFALANSKHKTILACYLYLAARKAEVFRLMLKDVDLFNKVVRLWTRKRKGGWEHDWLPMANTLANYLEDWIEQNEIKDPNAFLFVSPYSGEPLNSMRYFLSRLCHRAKVRPFSFKGIRHLTATTLYREGFPVAQIQQILRHKNPTTTEKYLRSLGAMQLTRPMIDAFDAKRPNRFEISGAGRVGELPE